MRMNFYRQLLSWAIIFGAFLSVSAQQCDVIYVAPNGLNNGAAGTKVTPASLTYGLTLAATGPATRIWMATGTYNISTPIQLTNNLVIEGGFDPATWIKSNATPSIIIKDNTNIITAGNALAIITGTNVSGFTLQDLTLQEANTTGASTTAYGIYLNACSNYNIVRCSVTSGNGSPGVAGTPGTTGATGGNGGNGNPFGDENNIPAGGAAGSGGGGSGGVGSDGGKWAGVYALAGAGSCGAAAGNTPGNGPGCGCGLFSTSHNGSCSGTAPTAGAAGAAGATGGSGAAGPAGTVVAGYYQPGTAASNGANGADGCGGGGGGGGSGRQQPGPDDVGGSGGGGGAGGAGGTGGTGGTGGGGSFAVFLVNNGVAGNIIDCDLIPGSGGAGGVGGIGGNGGIGGTGGTGGAGFCGAGFSQGANGGDGGKGGNGGTGGTGATGATAPISENGGTAVTQNNITSVPGNPPVIAVQNYGCTNAQVLFTSPTAGAWNFGTGATPATGNGQGPIVVSYSTTGRETITFSGTTFTDFVDIFNAQTISNTITQSAANPTDGCPDTFKTTIQGTDYVWDFGANSFPPVDSGTSDSVSSTVFTAPGTYTVSVYVNTPCCGIVKDSITFTVNTSLLHVSLTASPDTVCQGSSITFTATPGNYTNYTFLVNGLPVATGITDSTYTTNTLNPGDSVTVLGFLGVCYSNPSATLHPLINPIPAAPTLINSTPNDTACAGDTVTFTATPGYNSYAFFNGQSLLFTSPSNVYTIQPGAGNSYYVKGYMNGCPGPVSNYDTIIINQTPLILTATLASTNICQGNTDVATITTNVPVDSCLFFLNGNLIQDSSIYTYTTNNFNNGNMVTAIAELKGCPSPVSSPLTVMVRPTPTVTLISSSSNDSICQGLSITFTASPATDTAYQFFNGSNLVQDNSSATYTTSTLANNSSISVIAVNDGCPSIPGDTITTTVVPAPVVNPGSPPAPVCVNAAPVTLTGFTPTGGAWTGNGVTSPAGIVNPAAAGPGRDSLTYTYTDPNSGCPGDSTIILIVNPLPVITVAPASPAICSGHKLQLTATGGTTYAWSPATGLSNANIANPVADPSQTTNYQLSVTDANNCSSDTPVTVTVSPNPTAMFTYQPVCANNATVFSNGSTPLNSAGYIWNFGDGNTSTQPEPTHIYNAADSFSVTLIAELGSCNDTFVSTVFVYPAVTAAFSANPLTSFNDSSDPVIFTDQSTNATVWNWNFGDMLSSGLQLPSHIYKTPGTYTVTLVASNQFGCIDSATKDNYITIYALPTVFIPNAFTPGTGNANSILQAYSSSALYFEWIIFDRAGEKVYQSNNVDGGWDGTFKGKPAPEGVYSYYLRVVFSDNTSRGYKGTVTLLR